MCHEKESRIRPCPAETVARPCRTCRFTRPRALEQAAVPTPTRCDHDAAHHGDAPEWRFIPAEAGISRARQPRVRLARDLLDEQ
ncbi:hypothetical protein ACFOEY_17730 [Paracandidimonas soli]|uniref:hypothetical protein n=1 Tax=Paracandidimonas soli TaxID=1917182 RepID=UPI003607F82D